MRPTKLTKCYLETARDYSEHWEEKYNQTVPSIVGLANHLGVARSTIYEHAKRSREFQDILDRIQSQQEEVLFTGSLTGKFNPVISKLMLTKHGYSDKTEVDQTTREAPTINIGFSKPKGKAKLKVIK